MSAKKKSYAIASNPDQLGGVLGLSESDVALMKYKADLTAMAVRRLMACRLTVNEIVERSGVARSKVSAVKNGASVSVSCDLLVKIIAATGARLAPPKAL